MVSEVRPGNKENRVGMGVLSFRQVCKLGVFFSAAPTTYKLAYSVNVLRIDGLTTGLQLQIHSPRSFA